MNGPEAIVPSGNGQFTHLRVKPDVKIALDGLRTRLRGREVVVLDYPLHYNVGDLLILLGYLEMFDEEGISVRLAQTHHSHSLGKVRSSLDTDTPILFHGGGNFGDLYPKLHQDRLEIFEEFYDRELIVLPQTIYFRDQSSLEETRRIASRCNNLTIYVRDKESKEIADSFGANVILCPDTAHYLNVPMNTCNDQSTLLFRRRDFESLDTDAGFDWNEIITTSDRASLIGHKVLSKMAKVLPTTTLEKLIFSSWVAHCRKILDKAVIKFSNYERVDTDRLHAVLLASLMGMPLVHGDTQFGKITRYRETWFDHA